MKHLFVPYDIALLAKEKGFNEKCLKTYAHWNESNPHIVELVQIEEELQPCTQWFILCNAPLYQQLIDWFWQKHDLVIGYDYKTDLNTLSKERELIFKCGDIDTLFKEAFKLIQVAS